MWSTFGKYVRIFSIYSPQRRSKSGSRFGFVRFLEVRNAKELESQLDQIRIEGRKIWVNLAKYLEERGEKEKVRRGINENKVIHGKSFADVPEQRQEWKMKNREKEWSGMEYTVKEEDFEWLKGCYIGIARSVEIVPILQERFYMEGYFSCRLRAMGGKMVLMDCEDKKELKDLVQHASDWLGQWFSEVTPWSPSMVAKESTSKRRRFDIAKFLISTTMMESISVKRKIKVNGAMYELKFTKEELTKSLFSLKYDFMPSFNSDPEYDESWSDDTDYDDGCDEISKEADKETTASEEEVAGDNIECEGRGSRLVIAPTPEAKFELDGTGNDETQLNKGDRLFQSKVGEEETVEMVADSFDMEIEEDDVDGSVKEWMRVMPKQGKLKRKKKVKACSAVCKRSVLLGVMNQKKKDKGRSGSSQAEEEETSHCRPSTSNSVVGGFVGNSGIQNCNRRLNKVPNKRITTELWNFAKRIRAVIEEEEPVIRKLEEMEKRDRATKEVENARGASEVQKETKKCGLDRNFCKRLWHSEDFDWVVKDSIGRSGGLLCVWNSKAISVKHVWEGENFISIQGVWTVENVVINVVNVYSPCQLAGKRILWLELKNLVLQTGGMWCVVGDFNVVRKVEEKIGSRRLTTEMGEFDNFIIESELIDISLMGRKFTWYQTGGRFMSRIDRVLLSEEWLSRELIRKAWEQANIQGWAGFQLKEKLKITKEALKKWSKSFVPEIDSRIKEATAQIEQLDLKGESEQLSDEEIERRRQALLALWNNIRYKENMLQQKSGKAWLSNGDANTKFFHSCVKGRWKRNEMNSIQIKGTQYTEARRMKEEIASFFQNMFAEEQWKRPTLEGVNFKRIYAEENSSLTTPFTEEEIKTAIWDCESSKAPGPDGFNFKFIKSEWETIKRDVIGFLEEFQRNGKLVKGLNTSFIVLVPKVENPQKIEEYRPILLIGAVYKILAKTLANHLKNVLAGVMGQQQMAFISGRQLMDGVMIANEIVDETKKKKKKAFMLKIDFEKAYDKVSWSFLDFMQQKMGFSTKWRKWIMQCLKSSMVSVLVNGSPTRQFMVSRGLWQGDPLSPFLFLIIIEGINGLASKAIQNGLLKGMEVGHGGFKVSHLQYANDTLLFGEATEENVWAMKGILRTFELVSRLKINFNKSLLIGIGVEEEWLHKMAWIMCCKKRNMPFKYLGIPIRGSCRKISFWKPLVEVFHKKLTTWKGRYLSLGGRITLINLVLSSLLVFWMSMYLIPKGTILSLDKIRRRFLWGGVEGDKKINWVKWDTVCMDKELGGLGVKDLRKFNLALLGKWWGRLVNKDDGLWKKVILEKYGREGEYWLRINLVEGHM
ncbi:hypothetical protein SLEP1_g26053 [Rubroshorea leprosula]|uniref:Reverse transcriptase domain-containing protein n=1 Tax=Rubroshorea leprosula TaxID=152421 RepID=A0AAV5JUK2_9ROSI|nr:hypothetical protein SLEP1_g26053 [Rubroshorea leprosula]